MAEPLFFDCLTDAQFWSLLDSGVLQAYMVPGGAYKRLELLAPAHGCYLFIWPPDVPLPLLHDIVPSLASPTQAFPDQTHGYGHQPYVSEDQIRSEVETFCARTHAERSAEGGRILIISMHPNIQLRAGPYLEPQARDLTAMSIAELEAYLDAMLRLDDGNDSDSAPPYLYGPVAGHRPHELP
jgi:hypothetical protein